MSRTEAAVQAYESRRDRILKDSLHISELVENDELLAALEDAYYHEDYADFHKAFAAHIDRMIEEQSHD